MKRVLATALAALLILGVFATGAGASVWGNLTVTEKRELEAITYKCRAALEARVQTSPWWCAQNLVNPAALKDESKLEEFKDMHTAAADAVTQSAVAQAYFDLANSVEACAVAFKAGTLKSQLEAKGYAYADAMLAAQRSVCEEYLKPAFIDFLLSYAQAMELFFSVHLAALSDAKKNEFGAAIRTLISSLDALIDEGKWGEAKTAADNLIPQIKNVLVNAGILPNPNPPKGIFGTNARYNQWWHYILFFLCFGFVWMWF